MSFQIQQNTLRDELKKKIFKSFGEHALEETGMDGLSEDPQSFEIYVGQDFVGAIVVQLFWGQLHIKYLIVDKKYRGRGVATALMNHALEYGVERGCHFAFVETMSFQAPNFYLKLGFQIEFSRPGYANGTTFHYLKKSLISQHPLIKQTTRYGVYGVSLHEGKLLLVRQIRGLYAGKFDFPGGGMEFGETPEQTLRRELLEEVAMEFDTMQLLVNLTATLSTFFHVGMLYRITNCRVKQNVAAELPHFWIDPKVLTEDQCSSLLWKYLQGNN
jgi:8-oxo-dGTP pyrophosphatase MutT (NUDIX family)/GNAT superfamily N-acetyltransferase